MKIKLKSLTLIEVSELVEKLEKTFNISASPAAGFVVGAAAAAPAAGVAAAPIALTRR